MEATRRKPMGVRARRTLFAAMFIASSALSGATAVEAPGARPTDVARRRVEAAAPPRVRTIEYVAHNGARRRATVLLPAWYTPRDNPPLPLVISPHGRGATGFSNAKFFGNLPTIGRFAVVSPDGMGRKLKWFSYGYERQIDDLARMPDIVASALPWVQIDRARIYALGSSMGGQETLLLVARHPDVLAGAAAMDSVTDLARRFRQLPLLRSTPEQRKRWGMDFGLLLQSAMRREVGGRPGRVSNWYAARSPLHLAPQIADSGVPLQIWWSRNDRIVFDQEHQSEALFREIRRLGARGPVTACIGRWRHSTEMRARSLLPLALMDFGLLPREFLTRPRSVEHLVAHP